MIDQTRVQSGYDIEVLLGSRYLQHLLLLAVDVGVVPTSVEIAGQTVRLMEPHHADRTYELNADAEAPVTSNVDDPFAVEVLEPGHPSGGDVRATLFVEAGGFLNVDLGLYFRLHLDIAPADDGGLSVVTLATELVDVDGTLVTFVGSQTPPIPKDEVIARLKPFVDRSLDLGSTGSGGRVESIALRKLAGDADHDPCLALYLNLRLRNGPHPDDFLPNRGQAGDGLNFLATGSDVAFATRADVYGDIGPDARFRRAEPDGSGFSYPVRRHPSRLDEEPIGQLLGVTARPPQTDDGTQPRTLPDGTRVPGGIQGTPPPTSGGYLTLVIHGDYSVSWFPDPDYRLYLYLSQGTDEDGVMSWDSDSEFEAGILADVLLGVLSVALLPLIGPGAAFVVFTGLELFKELVAEPYTVDPIVDAHVDEKVDAALLDVAPNRFTVVRRRWDPFYETHHQIGLRPGELDVNALGLAMSGPAVLTRSPKPVRGSVIRAALRDADGVLTALAYRVALLEDYLALADVVAPGTDRGPLTPVPAGAEPDLLALSVDDAVARITARQLEPDVPYDVVRTEVTGNAITGLLLLSAREHAALRGGLLDAFTEATRTRVTTDQGATIRAEVEADFAAQGIFATAAEIDAETARRIEELVGAEVAAYEGGQLQTDLDAAVEAASTLVLSPDEAGTLQDAGVLTLPDYALVHREDPEKRYYRDRYVRAEEPTIPIRLADNLRALPRFRRTPTGVELL